MYCLEVFSLIFSAGDLVDLGICPTCFDASHDHCVFGDPSERLLFDNGLFSCLLISNPRSPGHAIITTKEHYKDMMELPDDLCRDVYSFARKAMRAIKEVYSADSVYLCTMCDGPMNHFHLQLIPRYADEKRGSRNFVKPRGEYVANMKIVAALREKFSE